MVHQIAILGASNGSQRGPDLANCRPLGRLFGPTFADQVDQSRIQAIHRGTNCGTKGDKATAFHLKKINWDNLK
jgi:hypothetical protein